MEQAPLSFDAAITRVLAPPLQVRALLQRDFSAALEQNHALITPTAPTPAYRIGLLPPFLGPSSLGLGPWSPGLRTPLPHAEDSPGHRGLVAGRWLLT